MQQDYSEIYFCCVWQRRLYSNSTSIQRVVPQLKICLGLKTHTKLPTPLVDTCWSRSGALSLYSLYFALKSAPLRLLGASLRGLKISWAENKQKRYKGYWAKNSSCVQLVYKYHAERFSTLARVGRRLSFKGLLYV